MNILLALVMSRFMSGHTRLVVQCSKDLKLATTSRVAERCLGEVLDAGTWDWKEQENTVERSRRRRGPRPEARRRQTGGAGQGAGLSMPQSRRSAIL